jgi:hypothetical protein
LRVNLLGVLYIFDYFSFVSFERERWKKRVGKGRKPRGDLAS